jgi:hypothetical protein
MQLSDYITQLQFLLHDQTNADFSEQELVNAINNAREVTALDFQCCRHAYLTAPFGVANPGAYEPVSTIQQQEIYPLTGAPGSAINGNVVGANVTAGGTGYSAATTVTFAAAPAGGTTALGVPVIANGVITSINVTRWGTGYTPVIPLISGAALPTVTIADAGGGTGGTATAVMFNNVFNVIGITYIWGLHAVSGVHAIATGILPTRHHLDHSPV